MNRRKVNGYPRLATEADGVPIDWDKAESRFAELTEMADRGLTESEKIEFSALQIFMADRSLINNLN